jgi:cytochrome b involved in lipid metabolism
VTVSWGAPGAASGSGAPSKVDEHASVAAGPNPTKEDGAKASKPNDPKAFKVPEKEFTMEEIAKHNTKENVWVVVKGVVLDLSDWLEEHPGGVQAILNFMGRDATEEFEMLHDDEVIPKYAPQQVIGRVKGQEVTLEP